MAKEEHDDDDRHQPECSPLLRPRDHRPPGEEEEGKGGIIDCIFHDTYFYNPQMTLAGLTALISKLVSTSKLVG